MAADVPDTSDRLLDLFAGALERQSRSFDTFSTKVEDGFENLRADLKWGFLLFAGVLVFSQLLMFALVGGSVWFQYSETGGVSLRLNDAAHESAPTSSPASRPAGLTRE